MVRRLPPLNAVRTFEAAARHLSFTRAAEELNVTQAAVSHQIKALEETLGVTLFRRLNRCLLLTEAGQAFLPPLTGALDAIADAVDRLRVVDEAGPLTVSTLASFAAKWLVPRLPRFQQRHPQIDVLLATGSQLVDFDRQEVDLAIRFGPGQWPGLRSHRLMGEAIFPVACPALRVGPPALEVPDDLARVTLLHDEFHIGWPMWLKAAKADCVDARRGPRFTDSGLVIQAAVAGQGVALARGALAADDIAAGRLVKLFDLDLPSEVAYYVVAPERHFARPKVALFSEWLLEEAAAG